MVISGCAHARSATGVLQCDLSRPASPRALYSAEFELSICEACGHVELSCKAPKDACRWLMGENGVATDNS
jgi:hypothetical protein